MNMARNCNVSQRDWQVWYLDYFYALFFIILRVLRQAFDEKKYNDRWLYKIKRKKNKTHYLILYTILKRKVFSIKKSFMFFDVMIHNLTGKIMLCIPNVR